MGRYFCCAFAVALIGLCGNTPSAWAVVTAADDASNSPYNDGWQVGDNGGFGFGAWSTINNLSSSGFGGGFIATNDSNVQIGTGASAAAFGVFGNQGGVGQAIRPLTQALSVGDTFSIKMDNGFIDSGGTVGFGLQNASGQNLIEFYYIGNNPNGDMYVVNSSTANLTSGNPIPFTNQGLSLDIHLTSSNTVDVMIDQLSNGAGVDATYSATLFNPSGGQAISQLRLFDANSGNGGDHNAYFNSITVVPEVAAKWFAGLAAIVIGLPLCGKRLLRRS
jgi:hypothetical protein